MAENYPAKKQAKKKNGLKALWLLLILLFAVVLLVIKITLTGNLKPTVFSGLPTSSDAYTIAKEFIKPTLKSSSADFNDSRYQFAKTSDSVYVIKSSVVLKDEKDEKITTNFKI